MSKQRLLRSGTTLLMLLVLVFLMVGPMLAQPLAPVPEAALAGWTTETVDSGGTSGSYASLEVDAYGYLHVSYYESTNQDLKYARFDGTGWVSETVDSGGVVGQFTSLALDTANYPHISYYDATNSDLKYAYQDAGGWHLETVDAANATGRYTSLALDSEDYPHISYQYETGLALRYAYKDGAGWHYESPPAAGAGQVKETALALNASDAPRIAYIDQYFGLYYGYRDGIGWHFSQVYSGGTTALKGLGFAVDQQGDRAYIAYSGQAQEVRLSYQDAGSWQHEVLANGAQTDFYSLALAAGTVHVAYGNYTAQVLQYAERTAVGWRIFAVANFDNTSGYNSIALDNNGRPHIAYRGVGYTLDHTWVDEEWWTEDIYAGVSNNVSLRYDALGRPRVCFYDAEGMNLVYGWRDAEGWHLEDVDTTWDVGQYCALALDTQGYPHISYYAATDGDLKYAYQDGGGWQVGVVDDAATTGLYTSLALDTQGYPHISYYEDTNSRLRYAYQDVGGWHLETADANSPAGRYTSLTLDATGRPHVAYQRQDGLYYAFRSASVGWVAEVVYQLPIAGETGRYASLAIEAGGAQHITFADADGDWRYATRLGTGQEWWHYVVDNPSGGNTGVGNALTLDAGGLYAVAVDEGGQLRYAYEANGDWYTLPLSEVGTEGGYCSLATDLLGHQGAAYYNANDQEVQLIHNHCLTVGVDPPPPICVDTAVAYNNTSFGVLPVEWLWVWGDGMTDTVAYPTHTYTLAGRHTATLTATNACGVGAITFTPVISSTPTTGYTYTAPVCAGQPMQFTNTTVASPTVVYTWTFGDGGVSSAINPAHTYATPGDYSCFLIAQNGCGQDMAQQTVTAHGEPEATLGWSPITPTFGIPVEFTVNPTSTLPLTCEWDFGDGQAGGPAPCGPSAPITHTYVATGTYSVIVTATDACGSMVDEGTLTVVACPRAAFVSNAPVCLGAPMYFTSTSEGAEPLSFLWDFGEGNTSTERNPVHTYAAPADYVVTLAVTNVYGQSQVSATVTVHDPVHNLELNVDPAGPAPGAVVTFTAQAEGTLPLTYTWNFGDGNGGMGPLVTHTYAITDIYTVTLAADNVCGTLSTTAVVEVSYCERPAGLNFTYSTPLQNGRESAFTATVTAGDPPLTFMWDFGDDTAYQFGMTTAHTYALPGAYSVTVAVWNDCEGSLLSVSQGVVVEEGAWHIYLPVVAKGFYSGDTFEPDNTPAQAHPLVLNSPQQRDFAPPNDEDWVRMNLNAGTAYLVGTSQLATGVDTKIALYAEGNYTTPLAENDDCGYPPPDNLASCLNYTPATSGGYYLKVTNLAAVWGAGATYTLNLTTP